MKFTVTIAQLASTLLDVSGNAAKARKIIRDSVLNSASEMVVFPEMFLTGYSIEKNSLNEIKRKQLVVEIEENMRSIRKMSRELSVDIIISYPTFDGEQLHRMYIACEYVSNGHSVAVHRKTHLCNYGGYSEHLNFEQGDKITVADGKNAKIGLLVCEDSWHIENALVSAQMVAEFLVNPSAACVNDPNTALECMKNWHIISQGQVMSQTCWFVCCNKAGMEGQTFCAGGSYVIDPGGELVCMLPPMKECVLHCDIDMDYLYDIRKKRPLLENSRNALTCGYLEKLR